MKKQLCLLLILLLLLPLMGCSSGENNSVPFYYCRKPEAYQYFAEDGVIHAEYRDLLGHRNDLGYMVSLYLAGPLEEGLISPFPKTARLLSFHQESASIRIELSDMGRSLTDPEFTLACACLTLTCLDFTHCNEVIITSGERSITMNSETIVLFDAPPRQDNTGG